jgi:hypothetical protein
MTDLEAAELASVDKGVDRLACHAQDLGCLGGIERRPGQCVCV